MLIEMFLKLLFFGFRFFVKLLPLSLALFIGKILGWFWCYVLPIRKPLVKRQIAEALETDDAQKINLITRRMFENLGMNFIEFFLFNPAKAEKMKELVELEDFDKFEKEYSKDKGVLVLTAHFGNWDLLCCSQALAGFPITIVSKKIKPEWLNDYWMNTRKACGVKILPDRNTKSELLDTLKNGEVVGFVIDQHAADHFGVVVEFFNRPASTTAGFAKLAIESNSPVVPIFIHRKNNGKHLMKVLDPIEIVEGADYKETIKLTTARYNKVLEEVIRREPDHWLWLHKRWKVEKTPSKQLRNQSVR